MYPLWKLQPILIPPEVLFNIGPIPVTNTLIGTWIGIVLLVIFFFAGTRRQDMVPKGAQNFVEWAVESLLTLVESVSGKAKAKKFFPLVGTFFMFILFCNLLDVFPGIETIGSINRTALQAAHLAPPSSIFLFGNYSIVLAPWVRPGTSDLNLTLAMALVSVIVTQVFGFMTLGAKEHLSKYFNFKALFTHGFQGPIEFFVGIIELITELSRILSFSFRLFGTGRLCLHPAVLRRCALHPAGTLRRLCASAYLRAADAGLPGNRYQQPRASRGRDRKGGRRAICTE